MMRAGSFHGIRASGMTSVVEMPWSIDTPT